MPLSPAPFYGDMAGGPPGAAELGMPRNFWGYSTVKVLPAVNEKVEGFFDTCAAGGLDGTQAVIVPAANVADLMLRRDVAEACRADRFAVYGVDHIEQALELFLELPVAEIVAKATERAEQLWAVSRPDST